MSETQKDKLFTFLMVLTLGIELGLTLALVLAPEKETKEQNNG